MILFRDHLFDKYLEMYDKYLKWVNGEAMVAIGRVKNCNETRKQMAFMIKNHLMEISEQLVELDGRITEMKTPEELYVEIKEVY